MTAKYPMVMARKLLEEFDQYHTPPFILAEKYGIDVRTVNRLLGKARAERRYNR